MAMVTHGPLQDVYFGFDSQSLLIRVDFERPAKAALADFDALSIGFVEPQEMELRIDKPGRSGQQLAFFNQGKSVTAAGVAVGLDRILEVALPLDLLNVQVDQPIQFYVEVLEGQQSRDRAPREGTIHLSRPSPDFEKIMWDV